MLTSSRLPETSRPALYPGCLYPDNQGSRERNRIDRMTGTSMGIVMADPTWTPLQYRMPVRFAAFTVNAR